MLRVLYLSLPVADFGHDYAGADHPLAGGLLAAAALAAGARHEALFLPRWLTSRGSDGALVRAIAALKPDVLAMSLHVWSRERLTEVARRVRALLPAIRIFAGGPETFGAAADFSDFDWIHHGEGEAAFALVLRALVEKSVRTDFDRIAASAPAMVPLERIPSPYLTGLLPPAPDGSVWIETMRGCPTGCHYCAYGKQFPRVRHFGPRWTELHLSWAAAHGAGEVVLLDPSFQATPGLARRAEDLARWNRGRLRLHTEARIEGIDRGLAEQLRKAGFASIETGLQSIHPAVLRRVGRRADLAGFSRGAEAILRVGIALEIDLILGLPGDTPEGFLASVDFARGLSDQVNIFPLQVLPGTRLRERAARLGLRHQERPPYLISASPTFDEESLRDSLQEAEKRLGLEVYKLHLADLSRRGGPLAEVVELDLNAPSIDQALLDRLGQCPAFLLSAQGAFPWDKLGACVRMLGERAPTLWPFLGLLVDVPFRLEELTRALQVLHNPEAFAARAHSLATEPYCRLSTRPFFLSRCHGPAEFWLEANQVIPVIRRTDHLPDERDPLLALPHLWEGERTFWTEELHRALSLFRGREDELLFDAPERRDRFLELAGQRD